MNHQCYAVSQCANVPTRAFLRKQEDPMIKPLSNGIALIFRGFDLAKKPSIRPYMIIPLIVNVLLFSVAGYFAINAINDLLTSLDFSGVDLWSWLDWLEPIIETVGSTLRWILLIASVLLILFMAGSIFTMITHILISPFIGILAEKVEKELHETNYPTHTVLQIAGRTFKRELRKLQYWLTRALGLLVVTIILSFIPIVQVISPVLWYLFGAWILALQYLDVPADNNGKSFEEVLALMKTHRTEVMGFGGAALLLTSTPILNLIIIPVAVAGGVIFWVDKMSVE